MAGGNTGTKYIRVANNLLRSLSKKKNN